MSKPTFSRFPRSRTDVGITIDEAALLKNPYLIYETTRLTTTPVAIGTVDRGLFPTQFVREHFPLPAPTNIKTAVDARRLRALTIRELEEAAARGDTLRSRDDVITSLRKREADQKEEHTAVTADLLGVAEEELFDDEIRIIKMADSRLAYQLGRFAEVGSIIRRTVQNRVEAPRHDLTVDWRAELDHRLCKMPEDADEQGMEERARKEKAAALAEIAASRFSVLIGSAGTGKTTLLSVLCHRPEIHQEGILLLAPTGKARVRMEAIAKQAGIENYQASTLAQFLARTRSLRRQHPALPTHRRAGGQGRTDRDRGRVLHAHRGNDGRAVGSLERSASPDLRGRLAPATTHRRRPSLRGHHRPACTGGH